MRSMVEGGHLPTTIAASNLDPPPPLRGPPPRHGEK